MKTTLKAGKYIVADPCYLIADNEWSDFCGTLHYEPIRTTRGNITSICEGSNQDGQEMEYKGSKFVICGTAYGDGCYALKERDRTIGELGVDAGLLSVIPVELAQTWPEWEKNKELGVIVELKHDTLFEAKNGNFEFGAYSVNTEGNEDEEDDYE